MIVPTGRDDRSIYERARELVCELRPSRRVTAEWVAGRLYISVPLATAVLTALADRGVIRARGDSGIGPAFITSPPSRLQALRRSVIGLLILSIAVATVFAGAQLHHIFFFVLGLGIGLLIAFAWLDWAMGDRL